MFFTVFGRYLTHIWSVNDEQSGDPTTQSITSTMLTRRKSLCPIWRVFPSTNTFKWVDGSMQFLYPSQDQRLVRLCIPQSKIPPPSLPCHTFYQPVPNLARAAFSYRPNDQPNHDQSIYSSGSRNLRSARRICDHLIRPQGNYSMSLEKFLRIISPSPAGSTVNPAFTTFRIFHVKNSILY